MSFYIAPYRYFSYIFPYIGVFCLYKTLSFLLYLAQTVVFYYIYTIETLIIGVFLYIYRRNPLFSFVFCPSLYIQCFPYSKNNTFLSIHFFCILPRLQCMFFLYIYIGNIALELYYIYIYRNQTFSPEKYVFYYIYRRKTLFLMYFPIYIGQLFGLSRLLVFLLYIETISFLWLSPSPQYFCIQVKQCFYIQHCLDYGISLYIGNIALSFLIYLAIVFLIGVFLYI